MVCSSSQAATIYRPRRPRQSPLYQVIERYLPEFERIYNDRYERRYGTWRLVIGEVARKFLRCRDLHFGLPASAASAPVVIKSGHCWPPAEGRVPVPFRLGRE